MRTMTSAEVRQAFLDFFAARQHTVVPSSSLVPADDPSLLFTNAGMNQFKDVFLGVGTRPYSRAVDAQKCMRVSGKHNDLEDVGRDGSHHTFFEMLGNWSFGDYYKKEAIAWAWEFLTEACEFPSERLWVTVFRDELGEMDADEESAAYWRSETSVTPDHIVYLGRKENFWEMADTGPCGPNTEIHYDRGLAACTRRANPDHLCVVEGDCGRFIELWNLVLIQYNRDAAGTLHPLPAKHVDTGLGFERLVAVLQGVDSNYETDLFLPIIGRVQELVGHSEAEVAENLTAYRVISDHGRAVTFLIGDGILPGNGGRNYVVRMILRRAARFGRRLGFTGPFMAEVADAVIDVMGPHYPELVSRRQFVVTTIAQEERRFLQTLDLGLSKLDDLLTELDQQGTNVIPGGATFHLHDTFGLPLEITRDVAEERGFTVDEAAHRSSLEEQRRRARRKDAFQVVDEGGLTAYHRALADLQERGLLGETGVDYNPHETTQLRTHLVAILKDGSWVGSAKESEEVEVILPETCFYVESGGQVADTGFIASYASGDDVPLWEIEVRDVCQPVSGLISHQGVVKKGRPEVGDDVWAVVDHARRMDTARNHTATHLLHSELRYVLGERVQQSGSLVDSQRLRFDFTHSAMLTQEELHAVSRSVNDAILANYPLETIEQGYEEALGSGAIALFGEKYGDVVRVVRVGVPGEPFSQELCGGTHVRDTSEIGLFHIVSEGGVGAGVRRIEAVTGRNAAELATRQMGVLESTAAYLGVPPDEVDRKVLALLDEVQAARKQIISLQQQAARLDFEALLDQVQSVGGVSLLSTRVDAASMAVLRQMTDWFRDHLRSGVVVLGSVLNGRPVIVAAVTPDLVARGVDAGVLVQSMARLVGGGGGGRPTLAQAGGRDAKQLGEALRLPKSIIEETLDVDAA